MRIPPDVRCASGLSFGASRTPGIAACSTACCADTSTCWPRPLVARSVRASRAPTAASAPACSHAWGTAVRTGGRSLSPLSACEHPAARIVRSDAAQPAFGPSRPNALTVTCTAAGLMAATVSGSKRPPLSSSTSASRTRSSTSSSVAHTTLRLPRLYAQNSSPSPRRRCAAPPGGSARTTSAPSPARIIPATWPRWSVASITRYADNIAGNPRSRGRPRPASRQADTT